MRTSASVSRTSTILKVEDSSERAITAARHGSAGTTRVRHLTDLRRSRHGARQPAPAARGQSRSSRDVRPHHGTERSDALDRRLWTLCRFYRYCHLQRLLARDPAAKRASIEGRPCVPDAGLGPRRARRRARPRRLGSPRDHALTSLLAHERPENQRSARRQHRRLGRRARSSHAAGGAQRRQARHHPPRFPDRPGAGSVHQRRATGPIFLGAARARMDGTPPTRP